MPAAAAKIYPMGSDVLAVPVAAESRKRPRSTQSHTHQKCSNTYAEHGLSRTEPEGRGHQQRHQRAKRGTDPDDKAIRNRNAETVNAQPEADGAKAPQKPKLSAAMRAPTGAAASTCAQSGAEALTTLTGMMRHDTTIKTIQMFSHFQRDISFRGVVNSPLQIPDEMASVMP